MAHHRKTAFIATVGKGDIGDICPILCRSISNTNPDYILLFATKETEGNAQRIINDLQLNRKNDIYILTQPKEDVESLYQEMRDVVLAKLQENGVKRQDVIADFTTGTKPMSTALVFTAIMLKFRTLEYIVAQRDVQGNICPGRERHSIFEPVGLLASQHLEWALELFRRYRFDSVKELLQSISEGYLSETERDLRRNLLYLTEAYAYWDLFDHIKFRSAYEKVNFNCAGELSFFKASDKTLSYVHQIGETLKQGKLTDLTIVDLINNARRRIEEGKYDDAAARLYRAIEMLAQWRLQEKHQIVAGNVDISRVPEKSKVWLKGCATGKNGEIQIPLYKAYQLLSDWDEELGKDFFADNALRDLLKKRNESILAHGTNPMSKHSALELLKKAEEFTMKVIGDYESKSSNLLFPWQKKELN